MGAIADLNDAVGGVTVTIPEDMTRHHPEWREGAEVLLEGEEALLFVQRREFDSGELGTNIRRIERQKQYMGAYVEKLKARVREDITFPIELYGKVEDHIVTSLKLNEIAYLADTLLGYDFSIENIVTLEGESCMGEQYEEFWPDEEALRDTIIHIFYEKVTR